MGYYEGYVVAFIDDQIKELESFERLHHVVFPTDEIALAYKFAWVQSRAAISVKVADIGDTVDWQLHEIASPSRVPDCEVQEKDTIIKVIYKLTETDYANSLKFLKIYNRLYLDDIYDKRLKEEQLHISEIESISWSQQREEAEAYTADNSVSIPLLTKLAESRGITAAEMVTKVNTAVENYYEKLATLLAKKQKVEAEIKACTTLIELHVVNAHRFGFYMNEDWIIEAGYDPATFVNATVNL